MKKVITLCVFVFAMFFGTESATAQSNKIEVNAIAAEKTEALRQHIKFSNTQRNDVYEAVQEYTQAKQDLEKAITIEEGVVAKIEKLLEDKMKIILNDEQFERYKSFSIE